MVRVDVLFIALFWFALGYLYHRKPETMYRLRYWPLAPDSDVGENVRTTYRRLGYFIAALGVPFLIWGLVAP